MSGKLLSVQLSKQLIQDLNFRIALKNVLPLALTNEIPLLKLNSSKDCLMLYCSGSEDITVV